MNNKCPLPFVGRKGEGRKSFPQRNGFEWQAKGWRTGMVSGKLFRVECWCFSDNILMTGKIAWMSVYTLINTSRYLNLLGKHIPVSEKTKCGKEGPQI